MVVAVEGIETQIICNDAESIDSGQDIFGAGLAELRTMIEHCHLLPVQHFYLINPEILKP